MFQSPGLSRLQEQHLLPRLRQHTFNFIEYAFGLPQGGIGDPHYPYADAFVMDTNQQHPYSLYDFFDFTTFHAFQPILGAKYPPDCFHHPGDSGCFSTYPLDPDNDANESD